MYWIFCQQGKYIARNTPKKSNIPTTPGSFCINSGIRKGKPCTDVSINIYKYPFCSTPGKNTFNIHLLAKKSGWFFFSVNQRKEGKDKCCLQIFSPEMPMGRNMQKRFSQISEQISANWRYCCSLSANNISECIFSPTFIYLLLSTNQWERSYFIRVVGV